jgi:hypothetical protein
MNSLGAGKLSAEQRKLMKLQQTSKERALQRKKDLQNKDPYLSLGFGLIAYRRTLFSLSVAFALMSLIIYPIIKAYDNGGALNMDLDETPYGYYSISNLGYSSVQCGTVPFNQEQLVLTCPFGNITSIVEDGTGFGVTPVSSPFRDACLRSDENKNVDCSTMLNEANIKSFFESECVGK